MSPANKALECATVVGMADNNIGGVGIANTEKSFNSILLQTQIKVHIDGFGATHWSSLKRIVRRVFLEIESQTDRQRFV